MKNEDGSWSKNNEKYNEDCCAEIKTLIEIYKNESKNSDEEIELQVYLILSDTARSVMCAKVIEDNIKKFEKNIKIVDSIIIEGLQTDNYENFEKYGINNLFKQLKLKITDTYKEGKISNESIIINISGGYKVIVPYMTIFAQVYGMKSVYIYEGSSSLITIPPLPIQIDWGFAEEYYPYLSDPTKVIDKSKQKKLETYGLLKYNNGKYFRTSLGQFFYDVIDMKLPESKSVMGYFFEYKLYEYYIENKYKKYTKVEHSKMLEIPDNKDKVEIDIMLSKENEEVIIIEVKSLNKFLKNINSVKWQIKKHKNAIEVKKKKLQEYHICLYTPDNVMFNELENKQINAINSLKEIFIEELKKLKVFIIKANYNQMKDGKYNNSNPYQQLMKDKLVLNKNFREIELGGKKC